MDHQDWPGWPDDDPQFDQGFEHGFDHPFEHADADTADLGAHDGGFDHDPLGHDPLGHDPLGSDVTGDDPLEPGPDGPDIAHTPGPDLTHEASFDDETPAGHGHFGAAGEVYPEDDPFAAGVHDDAGIHDGAVVHDDAPTHHDPGHDVPSADDHRLDDHQLDDHQFVDHPVGTDPDLDPRADSDWHDPEFPPALDLHDAPEPIDGYPWTDPHVLGAGLPDGAVDDPIDSGGYHETAWQHPPIGDLYDYAGDEQAPGIDGWHALLGSDDPATSTLARWWTPGT
jgi:hypothetical protein